MRVICPSLAEAVRACPTILWLRDAFHSSARSLGLRWQGLCGIRGIAEAMEAR